jgi:hypothetical protein
MWVRNAWGLGILIPEGILLMLLGWKLPAHILDTLYAFVGATCCLNAVESINDLFAAEEYYVGGEVVTTSDAHTVAEKWGLDYRFWAILWLAMSIASALFAIVFAFNARENRLFRGKKNKQNKSNGLNQQILDAEVTPVMHYTSNSTGPASSTLVYNSAHGNLTLPYSTSTAPEHQQLPKGKKKRNWFGFMKRDKKHHNATVY